MEISVQKTNQLKSIAILMMLFLHLFNRDYYGLFKPLIFIGNQPLSYYISLFCDACVPIFAFVSGYGLYFKYLQYSSNRKNYLLKNRSRLKNLYINYWIILAIFVLLASILSKSGYPGSMTNLLLNLTALDTSYNSTWWFLTTYIIFVLTSSIWFSLIDKLNPYLYITMLLFLYLVAFYFKVYAHLVIESTFLEWVGGQVTLFFYTLFQFMLGAFALKGDWNEKFALFFNSKPYKNLLITVLVILLVILHGFIPNLIIAPFTAVLFIFLFLQMNLSASINKFFDFFTTHSTNIWLIHAFIYAVFFENFIYSFHYVIIIYLILLFMCVKISYLINFLNKTIHFSLNYFKNKNNSSAEKI